MEKKMPVHILYRRSVFNSRLAEPKGMEGFQGSSVLLLKFGRICVWLEINTDKRHEYSNRSERYRRYKHDFPGWCDEVIPDRSN